MKIRLMTLAATMLLTVASASAMAKCEPVLDVSARTWGIDLRVTSASTQLSSGGDNCAYLVAILPIAVPGLAALPATGSRAEWSYVRPAEADNCQQLRVTSAAYSPPAGLTCTANLKHADSATVLIHRREPSAQECYEVTVRPILAEAVNPSRARQVVCLSPTSRQLVQRSGVDQ